MKHVTRLTAVISETFVASGYLPETEQEFLSVNVY